MKTIMIYTLKVLPLIVLLGSCYILPMDRYGNPIYPTPPTVYNSPVVTPSTQQKSGPITISARLYPANELAAATGVVSGTVTNMLTGKGRFVLSYKGDTYTGEATRVSADSRRGVASAFSPQGVSVQLNLSTS